MDTLLMLSKFDDGATRRSHACNNYGVDVLRANTVEAALALQGQIVPNVIVVDLEDHPADMLRAIARLRLHAPRTPIIAVGAPQEASAEEQAIRAGANLYMVQPLDMRRLQDYIRHMHTSHS